jgi:hypothetical protein
MLLHKGYVDLVRMMPVVDIVDNKGNAQSTRVSDATSLYVPDDSALGCQPQEKKFAATHVSWCFARSTC